MLLYTKYYWRNMMGASAGKGFSFILLFVVAVVAALLLKSAGFLYFHFFVESLTIMLSILIFFQVIKYRADYRNAFFIIIGAGLMSSAVIDLLHTLCYEGMGVFEVDELNTATQFWILGRYVQAVTFLAAIILSARQIRKTPVFIFYAVVTLISAAFVFHGSFPDALLDGQGLTEFKIYSEYAVIALLFLSLVNIYRLRDNFEFADHIMFSAAIGVTILSEYCFTLYNDVYGIMNFTGHIFKLAGYLLVSAVFLKTIKRSFFRDSDGQT